MELSFQQRTGFAISVWWWNEGTSNLDVNPTFHTWQRGYLIPAHIIGPEYTVVDLNGNIVGRMYVNFNLDQVPKPLA